LILVESHFYSPDVRPTVMSTEPLAILLVDDDDCALFGIAVNMTDLNIGLRTVTDAEQAIEYLEGRGVYSDRSLHPLPAVVVLDWDMRLAGGLEFLRWRRASVSFSSLPAVLFSAFADEDTIKAASAMGANTFIRKPLKFEDWETAVRQIWDLAMERSEPTKPWTSQQERHVGAAHGADAHDPPFERQAAQRKQYG
jgi:CheY-like chemotaxis protein